MNGSITIFTSKIPERLGKVYQLVDSQLDKVVAGNMSEGSFDVKTFDSPKSLAALLQSIGTNQAISASLPRNDVLTGRILTKALAVAAGCLARSKKDFVFKPTPGVLILDYDPAEVGAVLTRDELYSHLKLVCPDIGQAGVVWWSSGSSYICGPDGVLQGLKGQRLYILIQEASDIERAGQVIADRCWLHGLGYIKISRSGSQLPRSLWDEAMHEPARLDFIGGAVCMAPLFQQRGEPILMGGEDWLDTRAALPSLSPADLASMERLKQGARDKSQVEVDAIRAIWVASRVDEEAGRLHREKKIPVPEALELGRRLVESALSGTLFGEFRIPLPGGKYVTVADALDNWQLWDRTKTLDPLEPEHRNYEDCGILYLSGSDQRLFSFAHGGMTFRLSRQPRRVVYRRGRQSSVADDLAKALASQGDIFYSGGADLVKALPGKFEILDKSSVHYQLGHRVILVIHKDGKDVPINIPAELVALTYAAMGQKADQTPPVLKSVTSLPFATTGKRLVMQAGFDQETGIYNIMASEDDEGGGLPATANREDLLRAIRTLWEPWADYKWAGNTDRAGMLAAIFTAVLRPAMATAPGVFFDAPVQASGKTKAALALGALMTGDYVGVYPFVDGRNQEEEYGKTLIAMLRSERRFWLIDNVVGRFDSPVLAGLITSGRIQGRILGMSKDGDFSGRIMLCATGNNATLGADLVRRFLRCRIDAGVEQPNAVPHSFEPSDVARAKRMDIAIAVLTVLQAYWQTEPVTLSGGADFHEWSKLVREPIIWLQQQGLTEEAGIGSVDDPAKALGGPVISPDQLGLEQLLTGLEAVVGCNKAFQVKELNMMYRLGDSDAEDKKSMAVIREGIDNMTGGKEPTSRSLTYVLQNRMDRRVGNLRLVHAGTDRNGTIWQVRSD